MKEGRRCDNDDWRRLGRNHELLIPSHGVRRFVLMLFSYCPHVQVLRLETTRWIEPFAHKRTNNRIVSPDKTSRKSTSTGRTIRALPIKNVQSNSVRFLHFSTRGYETLSSLIAGGKSHASSSPE